MLISKPWAVCLGKQILEATPQLKAKEIGCHLVGIIECIFGLICANKAKWSIIMLIDGICSANMVVANKLITIWEYLLDL